MDEATARERYRTADGRFGARPADESDVTLDGPSWRQRPIIVEGRRFTMGQVRSGRFYHGTVADLGPGEQLEPGRAPANHAQSDAGSVSITSDPSVARYWAMQAAKAQGMDVDQAVVLEVEPAADLEPWRVVLADYGRSFDIMEARTSGATVLGPAQ